MKKPSGAPKLPPEQRKSVVLQLALTESMAALAASRAFKYGFVKETKVKGRHADLQGYITHLIESDQ